MIVKPMYFPRISRNHLNKGMAEARPSAKRPLIDADAGTPALFLQGDVIAKFWVKLSASDRGRFCASRKERYLTPGAQDQCCRFTGHGQRIKPIQVAGEAIPKADP
jgi:hypothetical protein